MVSKYIYFKLSSGSELSVFYGSQLRNQQMYKTDPDWQVNC